MTENNDAAKLLKRFQYLQEERTETYRMFDEGHKAYLASSPNYNFSMYKQLVHEITQTFKKISDEIMSLSHDLQENYNLQELAKLLIKIQEEEKNKLQLTAKLQLAEQNVLDHTDDPTFEQEVKNTKQSIVTVNGRINEHLEDIKYESEDLVT